MYNKKKRYVIYESQKKHIKIKRTVNRHGRLVESTKVMDEPDLRNGKLTL